MYFASWVYQKIMKQKAPYYLNQNIITLIMKPGRKWITNVVAAHCPFNCVRIFLYRLCGFKIGKRVFIGMRCYLDDLCYQNLVIGNDVTVSYGVYFACHGRKQNHEYIKIYDHVYIGMRASIISKNAQKEENGIVIGEHALVGACTLVNRDIPANAIAVGVPCRITI